jgi:hypothetical protein
MAIGTGVTSHPPVSGTREYARRQRAPKRPLPTREQMENEPAASDVAIGSWPQDVRILTSDLYAHFSEFVVGARESVHIIAPFIRVEALNVILRDVSLRDVTVVTTWSTKDIMTGASDLNVYPYLRSRGWRLYLHPGLHAKLLISDSDSAIVTSSNITKPGLGLAEQSNVECASKVGPLTLGEHLWLMNLVRASLLIDDEYFLAFKRHLKNQRPCEIEYDLEEFDPAPFLERQRFLLSSLPLSNSPDRLLMNMDKLRAGNETELSNLELSCTLHDMALFALDLHTGNRENLERLQRNFFSNRFIRAFADSITPYKFFGEAKAWIQNNCADVPVPRRRDLTIRARVLFDWFIALGGGEYVIKRPNHSECLSNIRYR